MTVKRKACCHLLGLGVFLGGMKTSPCLPKLHGWLFMMLGLAFSGPLYAQQSEWVAGGAEDKNWSNAANWNPANLPNGRELLFGDAFKTTAELPNNIVDGDTVIRRLDYTNKGSTESDWHVTELIGDLEINDDVAPANSLTVGGMAGTSGQRLTTQVRLTGAGRLVINQAAANLVVGNTGAFSLTAADQGYAVLNLSDLGGLEINVNHFNIGVGRTSNATVFLSDDSRMTAKMLVVGNSGGNQIGGSSKLALGQETILYVDDIRVGAHSATHHNRASGEVSFREGVAGPTLLLRGSSGGDSRASVMVGNQGSDIVGNTVVQTARMDFTGGSIDARISTLTIGRGRGSSASLGMNASFSMDAGVLDATTIAIGSLGNSANASAHKVTAALEVLGGSLVAESLVIAGNTQANAKQELEGRLLLDGTANVTVVGGITLGSQSATDSAGLKAILEIKGGSVQVGGDIAEGTNPGGVSSSILLQGGSLDLQGHSVVADELKLEAGTLRSLAEFNAGAEVVKTTGGVLTMAGTHAYTGATVVDAGTLVVDGTLSNTSGAIVRNGAVLRGNGAIANSVETRVESGGRLAPEAGEVLSVGALVMEEQAHFSMTLAGPEMENTGGVLAQTITLDGANLELSLSYAPVAGAVFRLIGNEGGSAVTGMFATVNNVALGLDQQFSLEFSGEAYGFELFYTGDEFSVFGGNDVMIRALAVPEPQISLLLLGGVAALLYWRRKGSSVRIASSFGRSN